MLFRDNRGLPDGRFLLRAGCAWLLGACTLLLVGTIFANVLGLGERGLGYLSSAISFVSAVTAGVFAARENSAPGLVTVFVTASALVIALLTLGLVISDEKMNASAVLSIVSFTYAGVLLGVFLHPKKKRTGKIRHL